MDKVGVFLCTGCEIGEGLDCDALEDVAKEAGAKHFAQHPCLCSAEGVATIQKTIADGAVNGVLIAACSHRFKTDAFRFDPYQAVTQRCGLREQVVWSHPAAKKGDADDDTQQLAADLVRMWTVRLTKEQLPKKLEVALERSVLVVGGGLTGLTAASTATRLGHKAILDHIGDAAFDKLFSEPRMLAFFRWEIEDSDFKDVKRLANKPMPLVPGSHYYYKNPDASDENSAFGGENVIYLGEGKFYAHGCVGDDGTYIIDEQDLMRTLSALRRPGADKAPYRIDMEMHMDGLAVSKLAVPGGVDRGQG